MTLFQTCAALYNLAENGRFNGEYFTPTRFINYLSTFMRPEVCKNNKVPNAFCIEITLPDGAWLCKVYQYADRADGYDYWIPEQKRVMEHLAESFAEEAQAE